MNLHIVRIVLFGIATAFGPVALLAQSEPMSPPASQTQPNPTQQTRSSTSSMQDSTGSSTDSGQMKDRMFLRKAAEGGLAEVQLGQLAAQKGSSQEVRDFGQKMVTDHTQLNSEMAPIAQSMGVKVPTKLSKEDQAEYDKLNGMSGDDFDKEYLSFMVKDHHKDLREFRNEAQNASEPALKAAVDKGSKVIYEHTQMVDKLAKDKGVPMPGRAGKSQTPPSQ